jgi:hypothetical protein
MPSGVPATLAAEELTPEDGFRLCAERLQFWRLCANAACRRARECRGDPQLCCRRFADWAEEVKAAAQQDRNARDPEAGGLRAELGRRILRLAETLRSEP